MLWRLQKELKLEDVFTAAAKRNKIPVYLRQCCSELLAEQGASPRQGRDGGDVQPVQGVGQSWSPSSCPHRKEGICDTWSWHFWQPKGYRVCEMREGCLCTDLGKGAGNGLSGDFPCLSLSVTGLG